MRQWLFEVTVGAVLIASSIIPALIFTAFALKFWPPFSITVAIGAALVLFGLLKARVQGVGPFAVSFGRRIKEKDKSQDSEHQD